MTYDLPSPPYELDALEPYISVETLEFHYGRHHRTYVDNLNKLVPGTPFEGQSLEEIIRGAEGPLFNNAAQVWNHSFYWRSLAPDGGGEPAGELAVAIDAAFGSFAAFKELFTQAAVTAFGSAWVWLVKAPDGTLRVVTTANAANPMTDGLKPLLTCDVWEHAYYIDYRNARPKYVAAFWNLVNWSFASRNYVE